MRRKPKITLKIFINISKLFEHSYLNQVTLDALNLGHNKSYINHKYKIYVRHGF